MNFDSFNRVEFSFDLPSETGHTTYWQKNQLNEESVVDQEYLRTTALLASWEQFENSPMAWCGWHMFDGTDGLEGEWDVEEQIVGYLLPMIVATRKARALTGEAYMAAKSPALIPIGMEFVPNYDINGWDSNVSGDGLLRYLGTDGFQAPWINPYFRGALDLTCGPDTWRGNLDHVIGNRNRICCSRGASGSWFCIELAVLVQPSAYSMRHGWSSGDGAMRNWELSASADGKSWTQLLQHKNERALAKGPYAAATWEIPQICPNGHPQEPARFFKVQMVGPHWGERHFLYCSGFELFGTVIAHPEGVDTSGWGEAIF